MFEMDYIEGNQMQKENKVKRIGLKIIIYGMVFLYILPVILVFTGVFMGDAEINDVLGAVVQESNQYATWHLIPLYPTGENILRVLLDTPEYFVLFWNSVKVVSCIIIGQFVFAIPAAWVLARNHSCICKGIMLVYMFCMLLPFQVTMLSQYIVLKQAALINTHGALILPLVFSTFPIFITYNSFEQIPQAAIDAACIDGAGKWTIYWYIAIPLAKKGIFAAGILGFFEYWNMVEQVAVFITDKKLWTLSVYLPDISGGQIGKCFAFSLFSILPAIYVLYAGRDILMDGIIIKGMED